ncbi:hypothetical protein HMPREF0580_1208 [Mobiluncus mulieris ATCC 35239]|uniref:Uncharacterized protein n=1 Tax=Mobiluncus mulieris ATCC 35239 TaxID=871571 RepID=E0QQP3_9ACTO|nr:hypothetical protein HMPREF0580_1208 [Mobiluncus mulieris ATCC 35239]
MSSVYSPIQDLGKMPPKNPVHTAKSREATADAYAGHTRAGTS